MLDTVLGVGDTAVNKTDKIYILQRLYSSRRVEHNKNIKGYSMSDK